MLARRAPPRGYLARTIRDRLPLLSRETQKELLNAVLADIASAAYRLSKSPVVRQLKLI
jgi:hypothetical protein